MRYLIYTTAIILILFCKIESNAETISFKSEDGLNVYADIYMIHPKTAPLIILFHQAGWSRGEYLEIAPKLNGLGFNCMAVDQRSGKSVNGVNNMTNKEAKISMKSTSYLEALPDIIAAIKYAKEFLVEGKLILWGSSYSSSLVLKVAGDHPDGVGAVLAFSPGEYFTSFGKPKDFIQQSAANITVPVFITSRKDEKKNWWNIYEAIPSPEKMYYRPNTPGNHGSRALWEKYSDSRAYWSSVSEFLETIK